MHLPNIAYLLFSISCIPNCMRTIDCINSFINVFRVIRSLLNLKASTNINCEIFC